MGQVKIKTGERQTTISRSLVGEVIISTRESGLFKEDSANSSPEKSNKIAKKIGGKRVSAKK